MVGRVSNEPDPNQLTQLEKNIIIHECGCRCDELLDTWDHCMCGKSPLVWDYQNSRLAWSDKE